jgi:hypothetical protein
LAQVRGADDPRWVLKHLDRAMVSDTIAKLRGPDDQIW